MSIYLSIDSQETIFYCQRIVFILTSLLNTLSMYCLLKKTTSNRGEVRHYLIFLQFLVICSSVYTDVLFKPIILFPVPGGYCMGVLCRAGISPQVVMGGCVLLLIAVGCTILSCSFYRHQTIVPETSKFRFSKVPKAKKRRCIITTLISTTSFGVHAFLLISPFSVLIIYPMCPHEHDLNQYGLDWVASRGPYFLHDRCLIVVRVAFAAVDASCLIFLLPVATMYTHMFYTLQHTPNKSSGTVKSICRSLMILLLQLTVPVTTITIPGFIMFASPIVDFISFEVAISSYCILILHPLVHNLVLLTVTPSFRRFIIDLLKVAAEITPKTIKLITSSNESKASPPRRK